MKIRTGKGDNIRLTLDFQPLTQVVNLSFMTRFSQRPRQCGPKLYHGLGSKGRPVRTTRPARRHHPRLRSRLARVPLILSPAGQVSLP
jgi:hypothetical protein